MGRSGVPRVRDVRRVVLATAQLHLRCRGDQRPRVAHVRCVGRARALGIRCALLVALGRAGHVRVRGALRAHVAVDKRVVLKRPQVRLVEEVVVGHDLVHATVEESLEQLGGLLPYLPVIEVLDNLCVQAAPVFLVEDGVIVQADIETVLDQRAQLDGEHSSPVPAAETLGAGITHRAPPPPRCRQRRNLPSGCSRLRARLRGTPSSSS